MAANGSKNAVKVQKSKPKEKNDNIQFWSDAETEFMLFQMKDMNKLHLLDGQKHRNAKCFIKVLTKMAEGFNRSVEQIHTCWKAIKKAYLDAVKERN